MTELEWMKEFGSNLKFILRDRGMTRQELAEELFVSESTISRYINGQMMPSVRILNNIGYVLECDVEELIDFSEYMG